ncbi:hypothetical protein O4J56_09065 [Nocardiopsis sp. RSe5-2]|uniref:Integral membrane protein n=1 Tax=Nocardiopsis endophytica TaxID=3018445 RepID=A0ABT4U1F7_9ACTN|nr:hypothetical protein [Nocardiopsis endophytica]MDA2810783.1 hypothetical protein [Nocardiopsis endophytica]
MPEDRSPAPSDPRIVELRIHGVSGGQAEELLDVEPVVRVGGDRLAGFFRWRRAPDTETVPGVPREIFAWGNLTSGRASRALWLLLLPFILANIAYWMRPAPPDGDAARAQGASGTGNRVGAAGAGAAPSRLHRLADIAYGSASRLIALSLTVLLVLAAAGIGMDLVGWQCPAYGEHCAELRPLLGELSAPGGLLARPGLSLAAGALLPLAATALLWRLSRRTTSVYEAAAQGTAPSPSPDAPLSRPHFWRNSMIMGRLRSVHLAVAAGTVGLLAAVPPTLYDRAAGAPAAGTVLLGLLAAVVAGASLMALVPGTAHTWNRSADRICARLRDTALVLSGASLLYTAWPRPGWSAEGRLPGFAEGLNTLFGLQCVLVAVQFAAAAAMYARTPLKRDTAMRGLAGPAAAAVGVLLGGVFSAAVVYQSAGFLGGCHYPGAEEAGCLPLQAPAAFSWLQLAFSLEAVIVAGAALWFWLRLRHRTREEESLTAAEYGRRRGGFRTRMIARARAMGRMTESLPVALGAVLLPGVALVALVAFAVGTGRLTAVPGGRAEPAAPPAAVAPGPDGALQEAVGLLVTVGSWLGALMLVALVGIGFSAYRRRPVRQAVGVLWDVGTFWPRVAHPLAPPSYAERTVPQLVARVAATAEGGQGVVLSGHSQGSVLAAATVWQLPPHVRPAVAVVTHGSPLYRLYTRYFPAYFGPAALADAAARVAGWRNLWRVTDPIGGPVHTAPAGGRTLPDTGALPDPREYDIPAGEALYPEILGHSFYVLDPAYAAAVREASALLLPGTVGPVPAAAPDAAHGGADVEDEDQGGDQG